MLPVPVAKKANKERPDPFALPPLPEPTLPLARNDDNRAWGIVVAGVGGEPAFQERAEREAADILLESRGQTQADGAEARHEAGVGEDGGGDVAGGEGRRARSPDRVDALVWVVDELMRKSRSRPRMDVF